MRHAVPPLRVTHDLPRLHEVLGRAGSSHFEIARARFEAAFRDACGGGEAVLFPSGRDALAALLAPFAEGARRRVVLPAYLDASLLESVAGAGLEPVFCDVSREDGTLDPRAFDRLADVQAAAVVVIHMYGRIADVTSIRERASALGIAVIEDCAHTVCPAPGSERSYGAFSSFAAFKLIDCGGGGGAHTRDPSVGKFLRTRASARVAGLATSLARAIAARAARAATESSIYDAIGHGLYVRLAARGGVMPFYKKRIRPWLKRGADAPRERPLPSAAFLDHGVTQFATLSARIADRRRRARMLLAPFGPHEMLRARDIDRSAEYAQIAIAADRDTTLLRLARAGIDALPAPMIACGDREGCPNAWHLAEHAIQLPWFDDMRDEDVTMVRDRLREAT